MPWIIVGLTFCVLLFFFPKKGGLLLSLLAGAASIIWGGIWAYNSWQDSRLRRIEISVRLPEYPDRNAVSLPDAWIRSGRSDDLRTLWQGPLTDREKRRQANLIVYGCAMEDPLLADIQNGNTSALLRYGVAVEAYQPGRSSNLAGHHQTVLDIIIPAGGQKTVCLPSPKLRGGVAPADAVFKASIKEPLFD